VLLCDGLLLTAAATQSHPPTPMNSSVADDASEEPQAQLTVDTVKVLVSQVRNHALPVAWLNILVGVCFLVGGGLCPPFIVVP